MSANRKWEGYTLEELRYQRALVEARTIVTQDRLTRDVERLRTSVLRPITAAPSFAARLLSGVSATDWFFFGVKAIRHVLPLLRKKSNNTIPNPRDGRG